MGDLQSQHRQREHSAGSLFMYQPCAAGHLRPDANTKSDFEPAPLEQGVCMLKRVSVITFILGGAVACYSQHLHLLVATPDDTGNQNYPVSLVRIEPDGSVKEPVDLIGASSVVEWMDAHFEWRKA